MPSSLTKTLQLLCVVQVTPLHFDPHHNLLAQVIGKKYIRIYPPEATADLSPYKEGHHTNASQVLLVCFLCPYEAGWRLVLCVHALARRPTSS